MRWMFNNGCSYKHEACAVHDTESTSSAQCISDVYPVFSESLLVEVGSGPLSSSKSYFAEESIQLNDDI